MPRSRDAVDAERRALRDDVLRQIDALLAEFHDRLPRDRAKAVAAVYARYSTRYQHSVVDQVRGCLDAAVREGLFVPREHVYFDLGVRGAKARRPGLDGLRDALRAKAVAAVLVFTTNRLFRKTYRSLQFVEEEIVDRGVRGLFVKSHVDTADERQWRTLLNRMADMDEFVATMYADNVRVAHEGLARMGLVHGTVTFGYRAAEVAGPPTKTNKPRTGYEIDPAEAAWVEKVFRWFADDRVSIADIVRRLNADPAAPLPPRAAGGRWTRLAVRFLLANPRYRGEWVYGRTRAVWVSRQDYARQVERPEPLLRRQAEELRVVGDELWYAAAARWADRAGRGGRPPGGGAGRPRLLNGLLVCRDHQRPLSVGGPHGRHMFCPVCVGLCRSDRPLYSKLNREVATRLTCGRLAELVRSDRGLAARVAAECQRAAEAAGRADPAALAAARATLGRLGERVRFVMENPGDTDADRAESAGLLKRLRAERAAVEAERARLEAAAAAEPAAPTEGEVATLLAGLGDVLSAAAGGRPADAAAAREAVELLTGGRVELEQCGERAPKRGWLRGRFTARLLDAVAGRSAGGVPAAGGGVEVVIDYREPTGAEALADRAKELYDAGLLVNAIAAELGVSRNLARRALAAWSAKAGEPLPDGRGRRATLAAKHSEPPLYRRVAGEVKRLMDAGLLLGDIARKLGIDRNTVTAAVRYWHESLGLPVPDGRTRRKGLPR